MLPAWRDALDIFVPPEQVIDTVDLYYLHNRQRRLSLRFLAWFILKENIQTDTHDSIEDALTALRLYKAHLQFESEGIFDKKLEELYKEGRQYVSCFRSLLPYILRNVFNRTSNRLKCKDPHPFGRQAGQELQRSGWLRHYLMRHPLTSLLCKCIPDSSHLYHNLGHFNRPGEIDSVRS